MRRKPLILAISGLAAVALGGAWLLPAGPDLSRGATIYAEACASCHGAELEGAPNWRAPGADGRLPAPPHDATGHTWHHPDPVLLDMITRGTAAVVGRGYESNMPGFGDTYSDAEITDVLEWIKSQWPDDIRETQAEITAEAEGS
ncbi:c-type cytochrome [Amaricoccus macauensis]|uniref:c-type cytochrome n=1 Tax=Amaricoccus macauensis TaxID=57001 RepID=UPI003C7E349E